MYVFVIVFLWQFFTVILFIFSFTHLFYAFLYLYASDMASIHGYARKRRKLSNL